MDTKYYDIPLKALFGEDHEWTKDDEQLIGILVEGSFGAGDGVGVFHPIRGYLFLRVLARGYTELPVDSSDAAWIQKTDGHCIAYSTSGRSYVRPCQ